VSNAQMISYLVPSNTELEVISCDSRKGDRQTNCHPLRRV